MFYIVQELIKLREVVKTSLSSRNSVGNWKFGDIFSFWNPVLIKEEYENKNIHSVRKHCLQKYERRVRAELPVYC